MNGIEFFSTFAISSSEQAKIKLDGTSISSAYLISPQQTIWNLKRKTSKKYFLPHTWSILKPSPLWNIVPIPFIILFLPCLAQASCRAIDRTSTRANTKREGPRPSISESRKVEERSAFHSITNPYWSFPTEFVFTAIHTVFSFLSINSNRQNKGNPMKQKSTSNAHQKHNSFMKRRAK